MFANAKQHGAAVWKKKQQAIFTTTISHSHMGYYCTIAHVPVSKPIECSIAI